MKWPHKEVGTYEDKKSVCGRDLEDNIQHFSSEISQCMSGLYSTID